MTGDAMEECHNSGGGHLVTEEVLRRGMHYLIFYTFFNIYEANWKTIQTINKIDCGEANNLNF